MSHPDNERAQCPLGENDCERLDELQQARAQILDLTEQARIDTLTGLYNYRHFLDLAAQELARTRRNGLPTALIMADLDHFKQVNDDWGHQAGNLTLSHCASLMQGELRKIDLPCRYGGEEFALLLPSTELPHAVIVANRLRLAIQQAPVEYAGQKIRLTISMGIALCEKGEKLTAGELVERADAFLYQAKIEGRNRVCHPDYEQLRPKGQVGTEEKDELLRP